MDGIAKQTGGMAAEGMFDLGRVRRQHARAYLRWHALRGSAMLPNVDAFMTQEASDGRGATLFRMPMSAGGTSASCGADLAQALASERHRWLNKAAPLAFRFCDAVGQREGLLLPLADADGRLAAFAVIDTMLPLAAEATPPLEIWRPGKRGSTCAWTIPASDARVLLGRTVQPEAPFATRLAAGRTWAALADHGPLPTRASGRHAALCAGFALLLRVQQDGPAWRALGEAEEDAAAMVARAVFGVDPVAALVLAHGRRMGLDAAEFAALLQAAPCGRTDLAAAEAAAQNEMAPHAVDDAPALVLSAVDHGFLVRLACRPSLRPPSSPLERVAA